MAQQLDGRSLDELWTGGLLAGTPDQIIDQLGELAEVGMEKAILQWPDLDDIQGLEAFAQTVLSQAQRLL